MNISLLLKEGMSHWILLQTATEQFWKRKAKKKNQKTKTEEDQDGHVSVLEAGAHRVLTSTGVLSSSSWNLE